MAKKHYPKGVKTFTSFEELGVAMGRKPRKQNPQKVEGQIKRLSGTCRICGENLIHVPKTNVFYCPNKGCEGHKRVVSNGDEEKTVSDQFFRISNNEIASIVNKLSTEK